MTKQKIKCEFPSCNVFFSPKGRGKYHSQACKMKAYRNRKGLKTDLLKLTSVTFRYATLYRGDCLQISKLLTNESIDAVIMDPPYCSGARTAADIASRSGMSPGKLWKSKPLPNDKMTTNGFNWMIRNIALQLMNLLVNGGSILSFIDWRQYPVLYSILESCNFKIQNMIVWDKENFSLGNGFRNQHELIIHAVKSSLTVVYDRSTPNVLRCKRIPNSEIHPTEKPVELIEKLINVVTSEQSTVLDPFMGSGTTGVACLKMNRKFIGFEMDPEYFNVSCRRINEVAV